MVNKKFTLLAVMLLTLGVASYAQTSTFAWDWKDSSVVPTKSTTQYQEFMQNKTPFPAKPRNAWEFGVAGGWSSITGDSKSGNGVAGSLTLRKAVGNVVSFRLGYFGAYTTGKGGYYNYSGIPSYISTPGGVYTSHDYKNISHNVSAEIVTSLNTFSNYRGDPTSNIYAFGGVGFTLSGTQVYENGSYHYIYPPEKYFIASNDHQRLFTTFSFGMGYAYKINKKFNIGIEERLTSPVKKINYVTGFNANTGTKNMYYSTLVKLNFNLFN